MFQQNLKTLPDDSMEWSEEISDYFDRQVVESQKQCLSNFDIFAELDRQNTLHLIRMGQK